MYTSKPVYQQNNTRPISLNYSSPNNYSGNMVSSVPVGVQPRPNKTTN